MSYPAYARSEWIADGAMHLLGVIGACCGAILLMVWSLDRVSDSQSLALAVYGVALVLTFVASAFYNMTPWETLRPTLRRIDHAAIFVKIAGTYTPLVVMIGSLGSYLVLGVVWALAAFGVVKKIFFWRAPGRYDPLLYLFMGWLSPLLIWSLWPLVPPATIILITSGGLLYSVGVVFYKWKALKFSKAIWHGFVVCASACFYGAIALGAFHIPV
ncbi:PAQR family membrane homeostasis protein TrhA [Puniceibacterium sediminis]|uniref:Hemolysin III n=1 Tax=Puniceibacterium sediminis TaxID=1608407 RepID=A0A238W170_9RHOB|nr:hemolysin III family protein [Puniceibacterium sediminis]SNR40355.1 hemolysin III [Puniceibacterium sediminis]